jgi:arabinogalactan oligomer/maltooligosaccharide transport system substrate-binding protein
VQGYLDNISEIGIEGMRVDNKLYGIPESSKVVALYYKKTMVDAPPSTTDELLELVKEGKLLVNYVGAYHLYGWASAFGGQLLDADNRCIADQGGWAEALHYLLELKAAGAVFETDFNDAEQLFLNGGAAMFVNGPWSLIDYERVFGNRLGVAIMPEGPKGKAGPFVGIDGLYINRFSKNVDAAASLGLFLASAESGQVFADKGGHVPVNSGVNINDPLLSVFYQAANTGFVRPQSPEFKNYWAPFQNMFVNVLEYGSAPEQAVISACAEMNQLNSK